MKRLIAAVFILLFLFPALGWSATYYVDHSTGSDAANGTSTSTPWAHCPGMSGWSGSASLSSGDIVVFKGGVTWTYDAVGNYGDDWLVLVAGVTYQGGQQLGSPWGTGLPVFDGELHSLYGTTLTAYNKSNITIDGIKLYRFEVASTGSGTAIGFTGGSSIEIKNCTIDKNGYNSVGWGSPGTSASLSSLKIHHNTISNTGRIFIAVDGADTVDDIQIYNNTLYGPGTWIGGITPNGGHADGIMIGSACDGTNCLTNLAIHHNSFLGDWSQGGTAPIYLNNGTGSGGSVGTQQGGNHVLIYNNLVAISTRGTPGSMAFVDAYIMLVSLWNDVKIYNNTFGGPLGTGVGSDYQVLACIISNNNATNVDMKNNIFSGCPAGVSFPTASWTTLTSNYNLYSTELTHLMYKNTTPCDTIAACQGVGFVQEANGLLANPVFVTPPTGSNTPNWHLQVTSPAIVAGLNLGAPYNTDLDGLARGSGAWDIGAYQYAAAEGDTTPPLITAFVIPATNVGYVVPITTFTCTDETALHATSYCVVEVDSNAGCSWSATRPASYTFTTQGAKTLYAFCRDAAVNISLSSNDSVTVTSGRGATFTVR